MGVFFAWKNHGAKNEERVVTLSTLTVCTYQKT